MEALLKVNTLFSAENLGGMRERPTDITADMNVPGEKVLLFPQGQQPIIAHPPTIPLVTEVEGDMIIMMNLHQGKFVWKLFILTFLYVICTDYYICLNYILCLRIL